MPRSFNFSLGPARTRRDTRFWLKVSAGALLVLNLIALFLYLKPPGGSRRELSRESLQMRYQAGSMQAQTQRMKLVSTKVEQGSGESAKFESTYFLPKRVAYVAVVSEIQRMAKTSGFQVREGAYTEEPVEGTPDLTLLNVTANFEGTYDNLLKFLSEADHSPMLLMLDSMTAAPQQKGGRISSSLRFQTIIREDGTIAGGQQ